MVPEVLELSEPWVHADSCPVTWDRMMYSKMITREISNAVYLRAHHLGNGCDKASPSGSWSFWATCKCLW